jgi:hypothetical protein
MGNDMYIWNNVIYLDWGMENAYNKVVVHVQGMGSHFSFQKSKDIKLVYQKLKGNQASDVHIMWRVEPRDIR